MADEFKDLEVSAPALSFGADLPEVKDEIVLSVDGKGTEVNLTEEMRQRANLTAEEQAQVDAFAKQIDVKNSQAILTYGAQTQTKLSSFSEKALENVRTKDMGEVGGMITDLVGQLKDFEIAEGEKGPFAFFKKSANKLGNLKTKYNKVEANINIITNELEKHQVTLMKDIDIMDKMYAMNLNYFKELTMYILAGKKKLEEVRGGELLDLQKKAEMSGLAEDVQQAKDLAELCDRFEKKIYDLELTRTIALQTGPQIRMVQNSDTIMVEKIQSTIVNTIPLWKNQMVIALGVEHAGQAAKAQKEVTDMTNELLKKNADALKVATVETAKASERGIVDMETLKHTNETLISTLDEVMRIQTEGKEKRRAAEQELADIENQLKDKMLQASRK